MSAAGLREFYEPLRAVLNRIPEGEELTTWDIMVSMELPIDRHRAFNKVLPWIAHKYPGICERRWDDKKNRNRYIWTHRPLDWHAGLTQEAAPRRDTFQDEVRAFMAEVRAWMASNGRS